MIQNLVAFQEKLVNGDLPVRPGQPANLSPAASVGDVGWQGDVKITVIDRIPDGYEKITPKEGDTQIAIGTTKGSRHCLAHLNGMEYHIPKGFNRTDSYEELQGPACIFNQENKMLHPEHGPVTFPPGSCVRFDYQRNLDVETMKEKRAQD